MAAYLRANEMFVRLGVVGVGARSDKATPLAASDTGSVASGESDYSAGVGSGMNLNMGAGGDRLRVFAASSTSSPSDPTSRAGVLHIHTYANDQSKNGADHPNGLHAETACGIAGAALNLLQNLNPISPAEAAGTYSTPGGFTYGGKIKGQMAARGFTPEQIDEAVLSGARIDAINKATGGPATRYINPTTGQSIVIDNTTHEVIQVGGPGFKFGPESGDVPGAQIRPAPPVDTAPSIPEIPGLPPGTTIPEIPE